MEEAEVFWLVAGELSIAPTPLPVYQRGLTTWFAERGITLLLGMRRVRLGPLCWQLRHEALPSPPLGFRLGDEELRVAVGLRVGCPVVSAHVCSCGVPAASDDFHGLSCHRSAGRVSRHAP